MKSVVTDLVDNVGVQMDVLYYRELWQIYTLLQVNKYYGYKPSSNPDTVLDLTPLLCPKEHPVSIYTYCKNMLAMTSFLRLFFSSCSQCRSKCSQGMHS